MAKSIIQTDKTCFICDATTNLEEHHIYFGTANRKISEKHGFTVWLCNEHHTGSNISAHRNREVDLALKRVCQTVYELDHSREEFMRLIGRNYLEDGDEIHNR